MTVEQAYRETRTALAAVGIETANLDARLLVCRAAEISHAHFISDPRCLLSRAAIDRLAAMTARRRGHEPVAYILGAKEFWGRSFQVSADTLVPRPESETVVAAVLDQLGGTRRPDDLRMLDLGTGSGCLLVTLLAEIDAGFGVGVDRSPAALAVARANARRHGVGPRAAFVCGNWAQSLGAGFDLIVANPPYIAGAEIARLAPEIAVHEPRAALDGGDDGLDAYRVLLPQAARLLRPGGCLAMEFGVGQDRAIGELVGDAGLARAPGQMRFWNDLTGRRRCLVVTLEGGCSPHFQKGVGKAGLRG